ncbi:transcription initiation factor TFIIH subunit 3 [Cryptococcus gattii Ru294]|nr:transcription initiation factor TFIIH subunit 3 [Cryptococcus gattii Ru294]
MPSPPSTLIVILDTHPLSWHLLSHLPPAPPIPDNKILDTAKSSPTSLHQFITILIVFLNAHLASKWGNEVVVYTASAGKATLIYPPSNDKLRQRGEGGKPNANVYRPFQVLDERIEEGLKEVVREEQQKLDTEGPGFINEPPAMVSALTKALCFINRRILSSVHNDPTALPPSSDPNNNTGDTSGGLLPSKERRQQRMRGGYVGLMNCVFAAQKAAKSPNRYPLPSSIYDRFFSSRLLTTSRPSDRWSVLAMEWKRGFAPVSPCTIYISHRLLFDIIRSSRRHRTQSTFVQCVSSFVNQNPSAQCVKHGSLSNLSPHSGRWPG